MLWSNSASDLKDPVVENTKAVGLERVLTEIHTDSGEHGSSPFPSPAAPQRLADQAGKANADGLPVVGLVSPGGRRGAAKSASLWRWESAPNPKHRQSLKAMSSRATKDIVSKLAELRSGLSSGLAQPC